MASNPEHANVVYKPPVRVPDYIEGSFSMLAVAEMLVWVEAVKQEFTMSPEVEAIFDGFREAYQGEIPGVETGLTSDEEGQVGV
jgi:hypothetical protein